MRGGHEHTFASAPAEPPPAPGSVALLRAPAGDASQKSSIFVASCSSSRRETAHISTGSSPSLRCERGVPGATRDRRRRAHLLDLVAEAHRQRAARRGRAPRSRRGSGPCPARSPSAAARGSASPRAARSRARASAAELARHVGARVGVLDVIRVDDRVAVGHLVHEDRGRLGLPRDGVLLDGLGLVLGQQHDRHDERDDEQRRAPTRRSRRRPRPSAARRARARAGGTAPAPMPPPPPPRQAARPARAASMHAQHRGADRGADLLDDVQRRARPGDRGAAQRLHRAGEHRHHRRRPCPMPMTNSVDAEQPVGRVGRRAG